MKNNERFEQYNTSKREPHSANQVRNRVFGGLAVAAIAAAGLSSSVVGSNNPKCEGSQKITAIPGDTLNSLKYDHIDVNDGDYVDLSKVDATIHRPSMDHPASNSGLPPEQDVSYIKAGDVIVLPENCE